MEGGGRDESILTDVLKQSWGLQLKTTRVGPLVANVGQLMIGAQPLRQLMLVVPDNANVPIFVAPNQQALSGAVTKASDGSPLLIHSATYPLLVSYPWYIVSNAAETVTVYEVLRLSAETL